MAPVSALFSTLAHGRNTHSIDKPACCKRVNSWTKVTRLIEGSGPDHFRSKGVVTCRPFVISLSSLEPIEEVLSEDVTEDFEQKYRRS